MYNWKTHTKQHLPELLEYCSLFDTIDNPMLLWIEIDGLFYQAVKAKNDELIKRIFAEADYHFVYVKEKKDDLFGTAVAMILIKHFLDEKEKIPYG
ncbi:hypothetical protein [Aquimarina sp. SS2-1]|uniref:hypothetical protein n=1 Tax=Aquimarina besae TaxID=3342247 RepID=UPI003671326C